MGDSGGAGVDAGMHPPTPKLGIDPWKRINNTKNSSRGVMLKAWEGEGGTSSHFLFPEVQEALLTLGPGKNSMVWSRKQAKRSKDPSLVLPKACIVPYGRLDE
ncbi:hypothetical protein FNV43_RR00560 [Rhamnella rubrinervis]|uniref:Uncharacterized protein n=1 Tax=Rhamnella rubrinervis TaxID=2594499 RepID=A0A8K0MRI6_9ROSA|nr:hypothetical protein FNV43_RR00560 [Rhamnella rubrinervis]